MSDISTDKTGGEREFRDLAYVANPHPRQTLDLFLPDRPDPAPLIVWIHGGAWKFGSKADDVPLETLAQGYAVASLNYRFSQHAVFPAQIQDCKAAVRWLRAHAGEFRLAPERFAAWGASAGGHLAALLGTAGGMAAWEVGENLEHSSRVQAVVDYFGPTDFLKMDAHRPQGGQIHETPDSPESELIGRPIKEAPELVRQASPVTYVSREAPPFLIVHGSADPLVAHHQSVLLAAALKGAGAPVTLYTVEGGGHGGFDDPQVAELTRKFLAEHLQPGKDIIHE